MQISSIKYDKSLQFTNCKCKGSVSLGDIDSGNKWIDVFIAEKWYNVICIPWSNNPISNAESARLNSSKYREYVAIDENGEYRELSRNEFDIIFYYGIELRDTLIKEILTTD